MIKDQKHTTKATQDFLRAKKLDIFKWLSHSPASSNTACSSVSEDTTEGRDTHTQAAAAVKASQRKQHLMISRASNLQAVTDCNGLSLFLKMWDCAMFLLNL